MTAKASRSTYTEKKADLICTQIAAGQSLNSICKQPDMPSIVTVYKWLDDNSDFLKKYARAKDDAADTIVSEIIDIADNSDLDPQDRRVKIDARKWVAGKLKPKKYGDKVLHSGDEEQPIEHRHNVQFTIVDPATDTG